MPKLDIVIVDELSGGRDGGFIIDAIHLDNADRPVVESNDKRTINRHEGLQTVRGSTRIGKMRVQAFKVDSDRLKSF